MHHELMANVIFIDKMKGHFRTRLDIPLLLIKSKCRTGEISGIFSASLHGNFNRFRNTLATAGQLIQILSHDHRTFVIHDVIMIHVVMVMTIMVIMVIVPVLVVIDVALTETARLAHYVLPAASPGFSRGAMPVTV